MHTVQEILDVAKQLPASERRRIVHELEATLVADEDQPGEGIDMFLTLAGTGHSEHTDVSSSKGKHLAEVYAASRDPR